MNKTEKENVNILLYITKQYYSFKMGLGKSTLCMVKELRNEIDELKQKEKERVVKEAEDLVNR